MRPVYNGARKGPLVSLRLFVIGAIFLLAACSHGFVATSPPPRFGAAPASATFNYTGAQQNFVVPAGVTHVTISASGGQGGLSCVHGINDEGLDLGDGGAGGTVVATVMVTPAEPVAGLVGGPGG